MTRECPYGDPLCPCQDEYDGKRDPCHYEGADAMPSNWVSMHAIRKLRADVADAAVLLRASEWDDWSECRQEWMCGRCSARQSMGHTSECAVGRWLSAHPAPVGALGEVAS